MAESSQQLGLVALPLLCVMGSEPVGGSMFLLVYAAIRLAVMATALLSIFAHGFSAMPVIGLYARKIATLDVAAPEHLEVADARSLSIR
jgi:hypothetical protein